MNYFTKKDLVKSIVELTPFIELNDEESSVIISQYGGRPLGIFPRNNSISLLWINPEIEESIKAKKRDIGGDRYWISPERDYFYEKPSTFEGWFCPSGLDPAYYEFLGNSQTSCTVSTPLTIENKLKKEFYQGEITRQFNLIKEPYKTGICYCGIEFLDDCVLYKPNLKVNGWSLACIISGGTSNPGTVLVPTKPNPKPLSYFRIIPENRIFKGEKHVAFKIDVNDIYKLAIRPDDIDFLRKAKIGYVMKIPNSDEFGFLVKLSDHIPRSQEDCFDISRDHPEGEIGVIQSYNSESPNKPLLRYGEIELQLNKFETVDNTSHGKAKHQLFSYIGTKDDIFGVIEKYLGISNPSLF
ncbi:MAG: DUF6786 family protein [Candidatus Thorarchaeota archaeon]